MSLGPISHTSITQFFWVWSPNGETDMKAAVAAGVVEGVRRSSKEHGITMDEVLDVLVWGQERRLQPR